MDGKAISEWMLSKRKPRPVTCAWPGCGNEFEAIKRREGNYCSQTCRSRAYRKRKAMMTNTKRLIALQLEIQDMERRRAGIMNPADYRELSSHLEQLRAELGQLQEPKP